MGFNELIAADPGSFVCPNKCGRSYKHKNTLSAHVRLECGVPRKFKCDICDKSFARKGTLKSHVAVVHHRLI